MKAHRHWLAGATVVAAGAGLVAAVGAVAPSASAEPGVAASAYTLSIIAGGNDGGGPPVPGPAAASRMDRPADMAFDPEGNLYVADTGNCAVEKITPAGELSVFVGSAGGCLLRNGNTFYDRPVSLAWLNGNLYIGGADDGWIYRADANGNLTHFAGTGVEGSPLNGQVDTPTQMTTYGNWLYFGDEESNVVARIDTTQQSLPATMSVVAGDGLDTSPQATPNLPATGFSIADPRGVAIDSKGTLYVSDTKASRILRIAPTGELTNEWSFPHPVGLNLDPTGSTLYAASAYGVIAEVSTVHGGMGIIAGLAHGNSLDQVTDVEPEAVAEQADAQGGWSVTPGPALATEVGMPAGVEIAANGDIYSTLMQPGMLVKLVKAKPQVPPFTGPDTPVVTAAPTVAPSAVPSISPSVAPSVVPTSVAPSVVPTAVPTTPGPVVTSPAPNPANPPRINLNLQLAVDAPLQGARATVSGGGLQPSSPYTLTMYSTPVEVARGTTNAAGAFHAAITMPAKACVKGGAHRLVLTGTAPGGAKLEDSSYVVLDDTCKAKSINNVTAPVNNTVTLQSFTFPRLSATLRPKAKRTLTELKGALTGAKAITITGYTETDSRGKAATKANKRLALKRAGAVRAYLRGLGVTVPISTVGAGGVNGLGKGQKFNRRVVITVRY